jgi:hypothetical protein
MRRASRAKLAAYVGLMLGGVGPACGNAGDGGSDWNVGPGAGGNGDAAIEANLDAAAKPPPGNGDAAMPPPADDSGNVPPGNGDDSGSSGDDASGGPADTGAPPPPPPTGPSPKRGIAYGQNADPDIGALSAGVTWWYNWSPQPDSSLSSGYAASQGVEFVPMIWGGSFDPNKVIAQIPAGAKYLLTFNEPNSGTQSNLTPAQAAALWPNVEAVAQARGLQIVSPALNYCGGSCNATDPFSWLDAFFAACTGCEVDYVAAHWYACTKDALANYISQYKSKYNKPIWLTEFSCLDGSLPATTGNELAYMMGAIPFLESDPMVFRYSWFTGRFQQQSAIDLLGGGAGTLTSLGQEYLSLPRGP